MDYVQESTLYVRLWKDGVQENILQELSRGTQEGELNIFYNDRMAYTKRTAKKVTTAINNKHKQAPVAVLGVLSAVLSSESKNS